MPIAVFSFGSFGDILALIQLASDIASAIRARGNKAEYDALVEELQIFTHSLECLAPLITPASDSPGSQLATSGWEEKERRVLIKALTTTKKLIEDFEARLARYRLPESTAGGGLLRRCQDAQRKISWMFSSARKDAVTLRTNLAAHGAIIDRMVNLCTARSVQYLCQVSATKGMTGRLPEQCIHFTTMLDETLVIPMCHCSNPSMFHDYMRFLFSTRPGYSFVEKYQYTLGMKRRQGPRGRLDRWQSLMQPGAEVYMSAVMLSRVGEKDATISKCPKCQYVSQAGPEEDGNHRCPCCQTLFRFRYRGYLPAAAVAQKAAIQFNDTLIDHSALQSGGFDPRLHGLGAAVPRRVSVHLEVIIHGHEETREDREIPSLQPTPAPSSEVFASAPTGNISDLTSKKSSAAAGGLLLLPAIRQLPHTPAARESSTHARNISSGTLQAQNQNDHKQTPEVVERIMSMSSAYKSNMIRKINSSSSFGSYISTSSSVQITRYIPSPLGRTSTPTFLHWMLLPYDPSRGKKTIYFDVTQKVSEIQDCSHSPWVALESSRLDKPAGRATFTKVKIQCRKLPYWDVIINNPAGITCGDILHSIHDLLNRKLTRSERKLYITESNCVGVQEAYEKRCSGFAGSDLPTLGPDLMRVDLLEGRTIFKGLSRRIDRDDCWLLDLGYTQPQEIVPC